MQTDNTAVQSTASCNAADPIAPAQASACQAQQHAQLCTQTLQPDLVSAAQNQCDSLPGQDATQNAHDIADTAMQETSGQSALQYGSSCLGAAAAEKIVTEPCSQLLEDTPMELWEYDGFASAEIRHRLSGSQQSPSRAQESAEALHQLEDFARCMHMPSSLPFCSISNVVATSMQTECRLVQRYLSSASQLSAHQ